MPSARCVVITFFCHSWVFSKPSFWLHSLSSSLEQYAFCIPSSRASGARAKSQSQNPEPKARAKSQSLRWTSKPGGPVKTCWTTEKPGGAVTKNKGNLFKKPGEPVKILVGQWKPWWASETLGDQWKPWWTSELKNLVGQWKMCWSSENVVGQWKPWWTSWTEKPGGPVQNMVDQWIDKLTASLLQGLVLT